MVDVSRLGSDLLGADANANFLKLFAGETLSTFTEANKFLPLINTRTISSGKSAAFPVVGTAAAHWHTAGESVITDADEGSANYLSKIKSTEREIFIDDVLVSSVLIDDLDAMKNHWDHRSEYSSAIGRALALECDKHILASIYAGSAANGNISGDSTLGGTTITKAAGVDNLILSAFEAAEQLDENDVPSDDRYMAVDPNRYYLLAQKTDMVNRDFGGSNGVYADGTVLKVAGFTIVKTNNMGTTNASAVTDTGAKNDPFGGAGIGYNGDWTNVQGLCFHRSAAGCVKMADLKVQSEYQLDRMAHLLMASYAMGHNYLRPEACVALKTS
ncbi:MAG: putative minor capsid protein 10B [Prokaryotic dsDNA virus sp.]|nr:MAG: putative minor capsid protein 10B [Prokaryotic dsDNA virus sp.]|tara:strand:- start:407 stop:1396 length:990 start_codon:yes stop_codon:yes gene_type:complete